MSRFSLVRVLLNHYSVPSRLIGAILKVRVRSETLELYHGPVQVLTLPRLSGRNRHRIVWRQLLFPVTTTKIAARYTAAGSAEVRVFDFAPAALAR